MKISVSTLGLYPLDIQKILDFGVQNNLKYIEIIKEYPYNNLNLNDLSSYDFKYSIHAPMSEVNIASHVDKIREYSVNEVIKSFEYANKLDANRIVVHPGNTPIIRLKNNKKIIEYNSESLKTLNKAAQEYGVMMCVENMPRFLGLLYTDVNELFQLSDELDLSITLDVGHAHNNLFSVDEMLNSQRIHHIHLSDNNTTYDLHDALGTHNIDFEKIFKILHERKYDDICVIEVSSKDRILKSIDYLKKIKIIK